MATKTVTCTSSTTLTDPALAQMRRPRPSGVTPRRLSTWYERSNPVAIPVLTIAVEISDKVSTAATKRVSVMLSGSTATLPKKTSTPMGITMMSSSCS